MSNALWVLGADDPEMQAIERLLVAAKEDYCYATCNGVRVHPGNAYAADGIASPDGDLFRGTILRETIRLVECGFVVGHEWSETGFIPVYSHPTTGLVLMCQDGTEAKSHTMEVVRIDHHRPGDPGHGTPPERFLAGSSIGQVLLLLTPGGEQITYGGVYAPPDGEELPGNSWAVWTGPPHIRCLRILDEAAVLTAAADHCLESAYRGRCPGVDPDALMRWRAESRAAFQKRPVEDVLADIDSARRILRAGMPDEGSRDGCFRDLRGQHIPELPEAACREGIPFLSTVKDRDGREKVVLQAAPADLVRRFLAGEIVPGLHDMYGSPERGLAGGYLAKKEASV